MQRGDRSTQQKRHSPYRRLVLPDNVRKELTQYGERRPSIVRLLVVKAASFSR